MIINIYHQRVIVVVTYSFIHSFLLFFFLKFLPSFIIIIIIIIIIYYYYFFLKLNGEDLLQCYNSLWFWLSWWDGMDGHCGLVNQIMSSLAALCMCTTATSTSTCIMWCELNQKSKRPGNHFSGIRMAPMIPPEMAIASC